MNCEECKKEIKLFIQKDNTYIRNKCSSGEELCKTVFNFWRDHWTQKFEYAKLKERTIKYCKGIRDE